jgi:hypothetical protein
MAFWVGQRDEYPAPTSLELDTSHSIPRHQLRLDWPNSTIKPMARRLINALLDATLAQDFT